MDSFLSAGEEKGVVSDTGILLSLGLAVRAGEGFPACNGLVLFSKNEDGIGHWLDIPWPDGSGGEMVVCAASDGMFLELSLGLSVTARVEVEVFNEEAEEGVLIGNEDEGDEPWLIKARLAPKTGFKSVLELGSGGVWLTRKHVLGKGSG